MTQTQSKFLEGKRKALAYLRSQMTSDPPASDLLKLEQLERELMLMERDNPLSKRVATALKSAEQMRAIEKVLKFLDDGLSSFRRDPADSEYQRGYEAALVNVMLVAAIAQEDEDSGLPRAER